MNAQQLKSYLLNLGKFHPELVANDVVPSDHLIEIYPGSWSVYLTLSPGLELRFWAEDKRFESVILSLAETTTSKVVYSQGLPEPYASCVTREAALTVFGNPVESKGPFKMPLPMGQVGGWDKFSLEGQGHPGLVVIFSYDVHMNVKRLSFALAKSGFDRLREEFEHPVEI